MMGSTLRLQLMTAMLFVTMVTITADFVDKVAQDGASGEKVVEQVVNLIGQTCIPGNELFLRRMAHVETQDGTAVDTYRSGYNGGIWKIDENMFLETKKKPSLAQSYTEIKKKLGIDWSKVTWKDLRRPIISGLAASLFVSSKNFKVIPESLELQATIWSSLRPGNAANDFFFDATGLKAACNTERELDLVIVLDLANANVFDIVRIEGFMEELLKRFHLSLNYTRVGLVSRNQQGPVGAWYLNSQLPGFSILNVLKALRYQPGPVTTEDALKFARQTMFSVKNGGRTGAAKVELLITDGITETNDVRAETDTYQHEGISMIIVEMNKTNADSPSSDIAPLVQEPRCRNTRRLKEFQELNGLSASLANTICNAPIILPAGDYTYDCGTSVTARLPDTTNSTTVQVSTTSGDVDVFGSKSYTNPDETSHDVHVTSTSGDRPVLFIRGTDPFFIGVRGKKSACTGTFTVHVKTGDAPKSMNGTCVIAGTVRTCTDADMDTATNDVILLPSENYPYLCNPRNHTVEYFPHPLDQHKFLMCDQHQQIYVGLCPVNQSACAQMSSGCKYTNPCPRTAILDQNTYYADPCGTLDSYVRCSFFGTAEVMGCIPSHVWNMDTLRCVSKYIHDPLHNQDITTVENPCVHSHSDHVYFPFPGDKSRYIFCESHGNAYALSCRGGEWNQETKSCVTLAPPNVIG